jgi:hypothetical protein
MTHLSSSVTLSALKAESQVENFIASSSPFPGIAGSDRGE